MTKNNLILNKWQSYKYKLENNLLNINHLNLAIEGFNNEILNKLDETQYMLLVFKIKTTDKMFRSISTLQRINKFDIEDLAEVFSEFWELKNSNYSQINVAEVVLEYKLIDLSFNIKTSKINKPKKYLVKPNTLNCGGFNLPQTMDLFEWGDVNFMFNETTAIVSKFNSKAEYNVRFNGLTMDVEYVYKGKTLFKFKDELLDRDNLGTFKRMIKKQTYHFLDGKLLYKERFCNYKMIKPLQAKPYHNNKFITMDLETRNVNGTLVPYAIALFDGRNSKTFYITDYKDHEDMLKNAIQSIMLRRYNGYKVYLHNFSNFDGIFLFKILVSLADSIQPIINDNRYVNTKFKFNDNKYKLEFRDSLLMLPVSLRKLAKAFDVEDKTIFPYNFISEDNIFINYAGEVPNFKYFDNITKEEYNLYAKEFKDKQWNLRYETLKYCVQDCVTLYQVLDEFFKQNFLMNGVNASDYVSIPSLNYANFRTRFLNDFEIPVITGEMYEFIKDSYYGGAVDVYKPYGKNVYRYDVNSLYPYIMRNYPMPIGQPTIVDGDSSKIETIIKDETKFSFVEVEIECPDTIQAPLILTRFKFNGVEKTIAPVGKWRGVYTSIEILRGIELGYKFKYYKCVYFTAKFIFKDFVDFYYNIKKNSPKTSSEYTISKLMLNSLYGRFGMSPYLDKHIVANEMNLLNYLKLLQLLMLFLYRMVKN